jgi:hypothetical protein
MTRTHVVALPIALALAGCSEPVIRSILPDPAISNPPPIEESTYTDEIVQVLTPKVDILWTIDNSCSMADEQEKLNDNFPYFMDYFLGSGLDYHVGVTSTDCDGSYNGSKGKLVNAQGYNVIDEDTPSPIEIFVSMASLGVTGSGTEKGLGGTYLALEDNRDTFNDGFYREEAALHTIVITDEPDFSAPEIITLNEFIDWYDGLKDDVDQRSFNTIYVPGVSDAYATVSRQVGGLAFPEDQAWAPLLDQLGLQAAGFKREYFLSHLPVSSTIHVSVENVQGAVFDNFVQAEADDLTGELVGDFTYDAGRNSITFLSYIPEPLSTVIIEYTLAAAEALAPEETTVETL